LFNVPHLQAPTTGGWVDVAPTNLAFAAIRQDGSLHSWGNTANGGRGHAGGTGFVAIFSTQGAVTAVRASGTVAAWGSSDRGNVAPSGDDDLFVPSS